MNFQKLIGERKGSEKRDTSQGGVHMPKPLELEVTEQQRQELLWHRDHDQKPYLRERCAALLMIADGDSARHVAQKRLYRPRKADTIYDWVKRYRKLGLAGLQVRTGRWRKPAFFPCVPRARSRQRSLVTCGAS
jgi:hypothetical protein